MIIKERDSKAADIELLESLLTPELPQHKTDLIKKELTTLCKGMKGENDAAYYTQRLN